MNITRVFATYASAIRYAKAVKGIVLQHSHSRFIVTRLVPLRGLRTRV